MDWSFGLLDPHEQAVLTRLAVFSGGWTLPAAELVCGRSGEPDVLDALFALLDDSLVLASEQAVSEPRLFVLNTVHAYAQAKLAVATDRAETERRHTEWVLGLVDPLIHVGARGFREAMEGFDGERANVRAAVQRAVDAADGETAGLLIRSVFPYLMLRDAFGEARGWLDQILPRAGDAPAVVRGRLLILRAVVADAPVEGNAVRPLLEEGRRLVPDDGDHIYDHALAALAGLFVAVANGALDEAARFMQESVPRFAAVGLEMAFAFQAMFRGNVALLGEDLEGAERHYRDALEVAGRLGDEGLMGQFLGLLGMVLWIRGDSSGARRSILDSASANRRAGQPSGVAYSLEALAAVALDDDRPRVAARALAAAVAARTSIGMPLNPALPPLVDDLRTRARAGLGDQSYDAACAEGRQWPLLEALDQTLAALTLTDRPPGGGTGGPRDADVDPDR
jgi:hypothetical protein